MLPGESGAEFLVIGFPLRPRTYPKFFEAKKPHAGFPAKHPNLTEPLIPKVLKSVPTCFSQFGAYPSEAATVHSPG